MKINIILVLIFSFLNSNSESIEKVSSIKKDCNGNSLDNIKYKIESIYSPSSNESTYIYDSVRPLSELNDINNADAFPWISADGLRLYYIHGTGGSGINNQLMFTQRASIDAFFSTPYIVPISFNNPFSFWLSANELDIYICSDSLYYAHRTNVLSPFGIPSLINITQPYPNGSFRSGVSLNAAQNELYLNIWNSSGIFRGTLHLNRTSPSSFNYSRTLPVPLGFTENAGQLSKDELSFYMSAKSGSKTLIYELNRASIADTFSINTFQIIQGINDTNKFNVQPSMSDSLKCVVFVRANTNLWTADELYIAYTRKIKPNVDPLSFNLFPNPASNEVYISIPYDNAEVLITDMLGRQVISKHATNEILRLEIQAIGIYVVSVRSELGVDTRKLVVSK